MNQLIFNEIQELKRQLLPNERVILFGSQARGDTRDDSDCDLLVLINKEKKTIEDEDIYGYPFDKIIHSFRNSIAHRGRLLAK
jgi:predicted nucleotidyltransferase